MKRLAKLIFIFLIITPTDAFSQASVGYYPWSSLISVSTNPSKAIWLDARVQTNSLFSSLSMDILPMVNLKRGEIVQLYLGGGLRFNPLYRIADANADLITIDGYSLNFGARIAPFPQNRNIKLALELNPYAKNDLESGVLKSHFGLVYFFGKKPKALDN